MMVLAPNLCRKNKPEHMVIHTVTTCICTSAITSLMFLIWVWQKENISGSVLLKVFCCILKSNNLIPVILYKLNSFTDSEIYL